jgi:hypothetical protein
MVRSAALAAALFVLAGSRQAGATVEAESRHTKAQAYNAALRYLRVDLAYEVTEKDAEAGYLLFRFATSGRKAVTNGSIEIVDQQDGVRVYVRLPELPRYHEEVISNGLLRKLRTEYGEPRRREEPPTPKEGEKSKDGRKDKS